MSDTPPSKTAAAVSAIALVGAVVTAGQQLISLRKQGKTQDALTESVYMDNLVRIRNLEKKVEELQFRADSAYVRQSAIEGELLSRRQKMKLEAMLAPAEEADSILEEKMVAESDAATKAAREEKLLAAKAQAEKALAEVEAEEESREQAQEKPEPSFMSVLSSMFSNSAPRAPPPSDSAAKHIESPSLEQMRAMAEQGKVWTPSGWQNKE